MNYHNKTFRVVNNSDNGQTGSETLFHYRQEGNLLYADYAGGDIKKGHLMGTVSSEGKIAMVYHHMDGSGEIKTGKCSSVPEIMDNGKIRLHETWTWTSGDNSSGTSTLEEV